VAYTLGSLRNVRPIRLICMGQYIYTGRNQLESIHHCYTYHEMTTGKKRPAFIFLVLHRPTPGLVLLYGAYAALWSVELACSMWVQLAVVRCAADALMRYR